MDVDIALSLMVLAAVSLAGGAMFLWRRGGATRQVWLMLVLAVALAANVLIWTMPVGDGAAPLSRAVPVR